MIRTAAFFRLSRSRQQTVLKRCLEALAGLVRACPACAAEGPPDVSVEADTDGDVTFTCRACGLPWPLYHQEQLWRGVRESGEAPDAPAGHPGSGCGGCGHRRR